MIRLILFLILGLGIWLVATSHQELRAYFAGVTSSEQTSENTKDEVIVATHENDAVVTETASNTENTQNASENVSSKITTDESEITGSISNENIVIAEASSSETDKDVAGNANEETNTSEDTAETASTSKTHSSTTTETSNFNPWMMWDHSKSFDSMSNMNFMHSMNPMMQMMAPMMNMMTPMMNPYVYMNPMTMMNPSINAMTSPHSMNAMMMAMNPQHMFSMFGQPNQEYLQGKTPNQLPVVTIPGFPTQTYQTWAKNKVSPGVTREAKKNAFQTAMAVSPLSMRDMISIMADKIPVDEGVSWDDAVEAMKLRANEVNFKFVGSSPLWKQIEAETENPSAKVEMFRFCDARIARKILDEVPEFIVFLPCKIALIEDGDGKLWVMTLDWDVSWLDYAQNSNSHLPKEIREEAKRIRDNIQYIMEGAATGDF